MPFKSRKQKKSSDKVGIVQTDAKKMNKVDEAAEGKQDTEEYESRPFTNLIIWLIIAMVSLTFLYVNNKQSGDVNEHIPQIKQSIFRET